MCMRMHQQSWFGNSWQQNTASQSNREQQEEKSEYKFQAALTTHNTESKSALNQLTVHARVLTCSSPYETIDHHLF